ncbi:unnamed protein product, partial [Prorocentrum cordatum]
ALRRRGALPGRPPGRRGPAGPAGRARGRRRPARGCEGRGPRAPSRGRARGAAGEVAVVLPHGQPGRAAACLRRARLSE